MISYKSLSFVTAANPRSESGIDKAVSSSRKKKVVTDLTLSVVAEKVLNKETGVVEATGKLKTIFKLSKECADKIDLQNVVGSIPKGLNAILTRPMAQEDESCVLFGKPKGKNPNKSRSFRAISLVKFLMSTGQIPTTFGQSLDDLAYFTLAQEEIADLPTGFKLFVVNVTTSVPVSEVAPVAETEIAPEPALVQSGIESTDEVADLVDSTDEDEEEEEEEEVDETEEEEDPFA